MNINYFVQKLQEWEIEFKKSQELIKSLQLENETQKLKINELENKLKETLRIKDPNLKSLQKDYNQLNIKYQQLLKQGSINNKNDEKNNVRIKKSETTNLNHAPRYGIVSMLQNQSSRNFIKSEPKDAIIIPSDSQSLDQDPVLEHIQSSQEDNNDQSKEDLIPTQYTVDSDEIPQQPDSSFHYNSDNLPPLPPSQETYNIINPKIYVPGTINIKEFPIDDSFSQNKSKDEQSNETYEVEDSQFNFTDDEDFQFPTPMTSNKTKKKTNQFPIKRESSSTNMMITPLITDKIANIDLKKFKDNTSTNFETPIKKKIKLDKVDLTFNPNTNQLWALHDFVINPKQNNNLDYAYDEVLRGDERKSCKHGKSCKSCEDWYEINKDLMKYVKPSGLKWNDNDNGNNNNDDDNNNDNNNDNNDNNHMNLINKVSKHRQLWDEPEEHYNFGKFDFPNEGNDQDSNGVVKKGRLINKIIYKRLLSSLSNTGKFMFKDEQYRKLVQERNFKVNKDNIDKIMQSSN
ncbi:hypothetical protein WICMUC_004849 [Wickerhamomyces mucosus]|uniref:DNA endonuclease activator Ctp1 C-terminal domain-containing protein n=1 Tax=Wickerhamomyces mucosus TaxID=1378264 RepID=A0A9P8T8K0_9ASCO|nr:hypothetical protein WICMUC_004849 [Wickerhamomyces mucosus]